MELKLLLKKLKNQLAPEEELEFQVWLDESAEHREFFSRAKENYGIRRIADTEAAWNKLRLVDKRDSVRKGRIITSIAAMLLVILGTTFFYQTQKEPIISSPISVENPVKKKNTILLTLDNGEEIELTSKDSLRQLANVEQQGNMLVYSAASPVYKENILTIPRTELFEILLADGTKVWLNSDSKFRYPVNFSENAPRIVELVYGEAYFEVFPSKNVNNKFLVKTDSQIIEVLGTAFNVKSYREDSTVETVLAEGSILLKDTLSEESRQLHPGFKSLYGQRTKWQLSQVDVAAEISWRHGVFTFQDKPLKDILAVVARWYDIEVQYENKLVMNSTFHGSFRKNQDLTELLSLLDATGEVAYSLDEKLLTIK